MPESIYDTPGSILEDKAGQSDFEIWNPDVAGVWSLLFTPIFGSIIVHKNWQSIGDVEQAQKSKKWIYISIFMALISIVINVVGFIYIITWYFMSQKQQTKFVKASTGGSYTKKSWGKPLLIAFGTWVIAIIALVSIFAELVNI